MASVNLCPSCGKERLELFCSHCGEKKVEAKDFGLQVLLSQALGIFTNLDSKVYKTAKLFFLSPGELSQKYVNGVRRPYMKPFQVFLVANILFFVFLSGLDIFYIPSQWFFHESSISGFNVSAMVQSIVNDTGQSYQELAGIYDAKVTTIAKASIVFIAPFIALVFKALHFKKRILFGKHLVFGIHYLSFFLIFCTFWSQFGEWVFDFDNKWAYIVTISAVTLLYLTLSSKRFYNDSWLLSIIKSAFAFLLINFAIGIYRSLFSIAVLKSLA